MPSASYRASFHGLVSHAAILGSEGGFARYRLRLSSWLWLATQTRNSHVWQDKSVADIVDAVFAHYAPYADWQWIDDAQALLNAIPPRSYCCHYRESDYDFVRRLLTEEDMAWRRQDGEDGQTLVLFADSSQQSATPEDASSAIGRVLALLPQEDFIEDPTMLAILRSVKSGNDYFEESSEIPPLFWTTANLEIKGT